jgi:TPR repeat protein
MSISYTFWKWRERPTISRGLCYLLVCEGIEVPELEDLDTERIADEIELAFPGCWTEAESPIDCQIEATAVHLTTYSSSPFAIPEFFLKLAEEQGWEFFDPQFEQITPEDKAAFQTRKDAALNFEKERQASLARDVERRAKAGDTKAMVELGNRFSFGEEVEKDDKAAIEWYRRAAELGDETGMFNLAVCLRLGEGTEKNCAAAVEWFERVLETDPYFASFALGEIYANGEGVPENREAAIRYFKMALENRHPEARRRLAKLGFELPSPSK